MKVLLVLILFIPVLSFGQNDYWETHKIHFTPTKLFFQDPQLKQALSPIKCWVPVDKMGKPSIIKGQPYEAFFCKLEVRTELWLGLGLRFHAGDYDRMFLKY